MPFRTPSGSSAHPRSRGENLREDLSAQRAAGSSPLTRGKPSRRRPRRNPRRLIPAHAGKTNRLARSPTSRTAHPRSRGENSGEHAYSGGDVGSSPLTRGKRPSGAYRKNHPRLIPAHAGKTVFCRLRSTVSRAHPRSRGENIQGEDASHVRAGSSPLTRGKRVYRCEVWGLVRLIPAHAGKTQRAAPGSSRRTAHPRSRGEN